MHWDLIRMYAKSRTFIACVICWLSWIGRRGFPSYEYKLQPRAAIATHVTPSCSVESPATHGDHVRLGASYECEGWQAPEFSWQNGKPNRTFIYIEGKRGSGQCCLSICRTILLEWFAMAVWLFWTEDLGTIDGDHLHDFCFIGAFISWQKINILLIWPRLGTIDYPYLRSANAGWWLIPSFPYHFSMTITDLCTAKIFQ